MWLQEAENNLDGAITTLTLGEQWHVLTHLRSLAAIQAGMGVVRRTVQFNPPERLEDPERGLNTSGVILIRRWNVLKATGLLDEEKLKRVFPNLQFLVTVLDL